MVVAWLLVLAAGQLAAFELVRRVFVRTVRGQQLDTIALAGNAIGSSHVAGLVSTVLNAVSVLSVIIAVVAIVFIALMRGRVSQAVVATLMIVGANVTTQVLKAAIARPDVGVDPERAVAGNSLPSGHTTVTASVVVALVLVLPPPVRAVAALAGAVVTALVGVATVSADWHRPSDVVAALLLVGVWAAVAGAVLALLRRDPPGALRSDPGGRRHGGGPDDLPHRIAVMSLALAGFGLLVVAVVALAMTDEVRPAPVDMLSRAQLFVAYSGSAAGIAGVTSAVMALVLATVHRVVPASRLLVNAARR
jgi:membrane-associated phospholipid phosphatase